MRNSHEIWSSLASERRAAWPAVLIAAVLIAAVPLLPCGTLHAQAPAAPAVAAPAEVADPLTETKVVARVTESVDKSLAYLASKQRDDGAWTDNFAGNALATLAFLGRGHVPNRGVYPKVLERGKRFILAGQQPNGVLGPASRMYEHALCTTACAELYGMDPDPELEEKLRKAVELIVKAQNPATGGWRYSPSPSDQDLSVSVMQIVALRAANNAEVPVPAETIERAVKYVTSCASPGGGFGYTSGGPANPQMSAAGLLSMQLLGHYSDPPISPAIDYLSKVPAQWDGTPGVSYFYYFHYYAIQGHYQAGGKFWNDWHPKVREMFLAKQNPDGSWDMPAGTAEAEGVVGPNKVYWTAMASLVLEIYMHFLPAYQR